MGGCLLSSLFQSKTSDMVCNKIKHTIAYQISAEEIEKWKSRGEAFWRGAGKTVFGEKEGQEEQKVYRPDTEESP